jgi:hypothetical protein
MLLSVTKMPASTPPAPCFTDYPLRVSKQQLTALRNLSFTHAVLQGASLIRWEDGVDRQVPRRVTLDALCVKRLAHWIPTDVRRNGRWRISLLGRKYLRGEIR